MLVKWDITERCNLACRHCYNGRKINQKKDDLTYEDVARIIQGFPLDYIDIIHFLGGEPLLRSDLMDILELCNGLEIKTAINTNGLLLTDQIIKQLNQFPLFDLVTISIEGYSSETHDFVRGEGTFDRTMANLRKLVEGQRNFKVMLNYTLLNNNMENIDLLFEILKEYEGIDKVIFALPFDEGNLELNQEIYPDVNKVFEACEKLFKGWSKLLAEGENIDLLIPLPPMIIHYFNKKYGTDHKIAATDFCPGGSDMIYINSLGECFPCNRNKVIGWSKEVSPDFYTQGNNLLNNDFERVYNSIEFRHFFSYVNDRNYIDDIEMCDECQFNKMCKITCPVLLKSHGFLHICKNFQSYKEVI